MEIERTDNRNRSTKRRDLQRKQERHTKRVVGSSLPANELVIRNDFPFNCSIIDLQVGA